QLSVLAAEAIAVRSLGHLRPEHRVMLGEWLVALDLELGVAVPSKAVEEERLLDSRDERMTDAAQHRVIRPDGQVVLSALGQPPRVVGEMSLRVVDVDPERLGDRAVQPPAARRDVLGRDERVGSRVIAALVDQPDRVENLHRMVGVEARKDLRDLAKVAIEELAQTAVVVNRARPGASRDEELEVRDAERVLNVDGEDAEAKGVVGGAAEAVLVRPRG